MLGPRLVILLIIGLAIPILFSVGPLRLSPYRLIILVTFIPLLVALFSGRAGKMLMVDWVMLFVTFWAFLAIVVVHGFAVGVESGGIVAAEHLGGYLVGRICIRNPTDFKKVVKFAFLVVCILLPFGAFEAMTGKAPLLSLFDILGVTYPQNRMDPRFGMERAQVVFEHPILFGAFCVSILGLAYYSIFSEMLKRISGFLAVLFGAVFSVSTGAIVGIVTQTFFIIWEMALKIIKSRWRILLALFILAYIVIDVFSNRTPFHVFVQYLTFSSGSAYNRILIFEFGRAEVMRHPIFGIGFGDWVRPGWMSSSVDNFWLLNCMRYGLPMGIGLMVAFFIVIRQVSRRNFQAQDLWSCQAGFLTSHGGLFIVAGTVHFWNAMLVWYMCLLGAGVWMITHQEGDADTEHRSDKRPAARRRNSARRTVL